MSTFLYCVGSALAGSGALAMAALVEGRYHSYHALLKYNPKHDCVPQFVGAGVESVPVRCDTSGFVMPELKPETVNAFLELNLRTSIAGGLSDPAVEIHSRGFYDVQVLERGVRGVRFLNVSRLLAAGVAAGEKVRLRGRRL